MLSALCLPRRSSARKLIGRATAVLIVIALFFVWQRRRGGGDGNDVPFWSRPVDYDATEQLNDRDFNGVNAIVKLPDSDRVERTDDRHFQMQNFNVANSAAAIASAADIRTNSVRIARDWTEIDKQIAADFAQVVIGAGHMGMAVKLSAEEQAMADLLITKEAFNIVASNKISLNRTTPDNRHNLCKSIAYGDLLPVASVVIIFTNEAWSALLRTVHTVLNYTPGHLLHEIVLLDDFSDRVEVKDKLDRYIEKHLPSKVKLIRASKRLGLIRARLEGARAATGQVIVFLDSHCEATQGWLEPLLYRIKENRHAVVMPIIDVIDEKTMEFYKSEGTHFQVGGFTWSGHFTWVSIPEREIQRRGSPIGPTRSPTMAGGLFALDRNFFWEIGSYDDGMEVWGGENLEMSFRIWMCGGLLETIPCSHVGHIFRSFHPYTFPGGKDTHGINTVRMAEVWMDDYKRLFYLHRKELETVDYGDVSGRKELRKKMKCTSFKWFLENIFPEKFILDEDVVAYGRVRNGKNANLCLDMLQRDEKKSYNMGLYACHMFIGSSQFMALSKNSEFRREDVCAEVTQYLFRYTDHVLMTTCNGLRGGQEWVHTKHGTIMNTASGKCLDAMNSVNDEDVWAQPCNGDSSQNWSFDVYLDV